MKFQRTTSNCALVAGFFQNPESALTTLRELRRQGFRRSAAVSCSDSGEITVPRGSAFRVSDDVIVRFKRWVLRNETVVLVETAPQRTGRVLALLREDKGEPPAVYVFQPERAFDSEPESRLIRHEPPNSERMVRQATQLAQSLSIAKGERSTCTLLLRRLGESERILQWADLSLSMSAEAHQSAALSAEWLLDNAYLIRAQVENIRRNLPQAYCNELPAIAAGPQAGLPRIYRVASEMVAGADAVLDAATIRDFLDGFQTVSALNIGELWALPSMLRLRLVECLRMLAIQVERAQRQSEQADFWANRLISVLRSAPTQLAQMMAELVREYPEPTPYFASELAAHLYDEEAALPMVSDWLERALGAPLYEVIQEEERRRAVEQTALANAITSCRRLTQIEWRGLVESVSRAHAELSQDPAEIYPYMDFETRNGYRGAVEQIAKGSDQPELEVIAQLMELAQERRDEVERHVGYYLVDEGRAGLEKKLGCRVPLAERFRRALRHHAAAVYIGGIGALTLALTAVVLAMAHAGGTGAGWLIGFGLLLAFPASELALQMVNYGVTRCLPPDTLPKMSFKKEGIPKECRTLVVVPMLLTTPDAIRNEVERLEIRYLGNSDPQICFALLSDFADAPRQHMPEDAEYLEIVAQGIEELNRRHGAGRFFLFHRQRVWNESEKCWMGWERKRGKLEQLNRYLMGETAPEITDLLFMGDRDLLNGIRYIITLDADTQLLRDSARRLVETLSHPLNQARFSPDGRTVVRGYTIIQPRVSTTLPSAIATWFSRIFADPCGLDPYSHAVSDVYQDLTGEGCYHGKGIYDLHAFHRVLSRRFPQSHLLSHDLIEGVHGRVGLASDIELLDVFPSSYITWGGRQHRWIRGDWQIIDWLKRKVPIEDGGMVRNPLSAMSRWKIFDNLRRSLVPAATVAMLVVGWVFTPTPGLWSVVGGVFLLWPALSQLIVQAASGALPGQDFSNVLLRCLVWTAFLPDQALMALDAILRVIYRRHISRQLLLEWETAHDAHRRRNGRQRKFLLGMTWIPVCSVILLGLAGIFLPPGTFGAMVPFALLWAFSPLLVPLIDLPVPSLHERILTPEDRRNLRHTARLTWRYFDDFVGPQTHWLPPDNYQETHKKEVFMRTSPTNIGLWLLAGLTARDFGYLSVDEMLRRHLATLETLGKLERFEGHLLNWYDIGDLSSLKPRYVSTVDSGNLLACLWALEAGYRELLAEPVFGPSALRGIADAVAILRQIPESGSAAFDAALDALETLVAAEPMDTEDVVYRIRSAAPPARELAEAATADDPRFYWAQQIDKEVRAWNEIIDRYLKPLEILAAPPAQVLSIHGDAHAWRREALASPFSLASLAAGDIPRMALLLSYQARVTELNLPAPIAAWLDELAQAVAQARERAVEQMALAQTIICNLGSLADAMDMRFLYDPQRRLFATGYRVGERCLDNSFYDLLASESRLASLVSIARGDVPVEHWWALGRPFGSANGCLPLLSWTGTMFEYLMPVLLTRICDNSLLGRACRDAVKCQADYGKARGVPWGISESAFSALDRHHIYQYRAFGVPTLGLKRGLERDLVIAPYASALALLVAPAEAMDNLRRLSALENGALVGQYGYYEAVDYSRQRAPRSEPGIVVHCYMVHHQGMSFLAFGNVLHEGSMQRRFHADPRIRATEALLHEHIPQGVTPSVGEVREERPRPHAIPITGIAAEHSHKPDTLTPKVQLLSNGNYSVMVTNAGGGYSRWRGLDLTRWRADTTRDVAGMACYFKDLESGVIWSATHQPIHCQEQHYTWNFTPEKAEFRRRCSGSCDTFLEIAVSAEDDAEIRRVTLVNNSRQSCRIELTSYVELALAPHNADRAHPAFSKLFIETQWLPEFQALIARRRPRSPEDQAVWIAHLMVGATRSTELPQHETDRALFLGRGRTTENPQALERDLSQTTGDVLDPILSLRRRVVIARNQRVQFSLVTVAAESREALVALVQRYTEFRAADRAFDTAWTHAQLEMRRLHIHPGDAQLFQQLAAHVLYPQTQLRPPSARLGRGVDGQRALWAQGISGDLPIVAVSIGDRGDVELVRQVLTAHTFWYLRGLRVDLVLISEEAEGYEEPLADHLRRMAEAYTQITGVDVPGGVFLRSARKMPPEELSAILAAARAVLVAARGALRQQLAVPAPVNPLPPRFTPVHGVREEPSTTLPFMELQYFNGLGGFTRDGREYAIYLGPQMQTPLPWVNVMANPNFGTLVSESGSGFTWVGNSQSARLTPWSNDPVSDSADSAIYLRDEEMGVFWSPTPLPIRELDAYRCRHGQGYTIFEHNSHAIEQELTVFVPMNAEGGLPVRLQRLRLRNVSSRRRRISVTSYAGLVLGSDCEETQLHVATKWDLKSSSLFARNVYHPDFRDRVTFASSSPAPTSYTGDRSGFIGRNRSLNNPLAMEGARLSGVARPGLDPCAAVQTMLEIEPGQQVEVTFMLGQTAGKSQAQSLVEEFRDPANVERALQETCQWWDDFLGTLEVHTPLLSADWIVNRWLLYQTLSCRIWGRSAFYQSGGAFGFRDQLQDVMALTVAAPAMAREQIVRAASRQFVEGDVQHWWHPQSGAGVRTRISDDLLWLPYVTAHYVRTTGDSAVLREEIPFLEAKLLEETEVESFSVPAVSSDHGTLLEHCRRAIERAITMGEHSLPLMGGGDWNDGMNRVGIKGRGESVWLGWFLVCVLNDFSRLLEDQGERSEAQGCRVLAQKLTQSIEDKTWDGGWYRRAYDDNGVPLGSSENEEARIDSLAQSWAAISGVANPSRVDQALLAVDEQLVCDEHQIILLFTPPFERAQREVGYIQAYPPGVRENGGQYTHAAVWVALAFACRGDGSRAVELLQMLNPAEHARDPESVERYKTEPYAVAADVYALKDRKGRGGWTWYTGAAGWMYRVWLEAVLGFQLIEGKRLTFDPVLPKEWPEVRLRYRYHATPYEIVIENPRQTGHGVTRLELDGAPVPFISLNDDGQPHAVRVIL